MRIKLDHPIPTSTLTELCKGKATVLSETVATHLATDSREIERGDVFAALPGKNTSGELYAGEAKERGAAAILHTDAIGALSTLAKAARRRLKAKVIAVTGSVGKTSTKELLRAIFSVRGRVHATQDNQNNELGVPLTLLSAPSDSNFLIVEMGMRRRGEIAVLSAMTEPGAAVITAIGQAHLETLGSISEIRRAKYEITEGLPKNGLLFTGVGVTPPVEYQGTHVLYPLSSKDTETPSVFGIESEKSGVFFSLRFKRKRIERLFVPALGKHMARNAALASLVALAHGLSEKELREGLLLYKGISLREEKRDINGISVFLDCYNASPESMAAAAELLKSAREASPTSHAYALLGDMLELGRDASALHIAVGEIFGRLPIDGIAAFGDHKDDLLSGARMTGFRGLLSGDPQELSDHLQKGDVLLVKASRGMEGEKLVTEILREGQK